MVIIIVIVESVAMINHIVVGFVRVGMVNCMAVGLTRVAITIIKVTAVVKLNTADVQTMTQVLQIQSFKGGVGKTTTAVNLAHGFALKGKRVLLIDLDHQGNATRGLGYEVGETTPTLYHVLVGGLNWDEAAATVRENLDLLPSNKLTALAEGAMYPMLARENILKKRLESAEGEYDIIVMDCPASLGILHVNALNFATHIVVPVQVGVWAVDGLEQIFQSMEEVGAATGRMPAVLGALLTMVDERYKLTEEVRELVGASFDGKLLPPIRTDADLMNAPKNHETIFEYNPNSKGAADYSELAAYLLKKLRPKMEEKEKKGSAKNKKIK